MEYSFLVDRIAQPHPLCQLIVVKDPYRQQVTLFSFHSTFQSIFHSKACAYKLPISSCLCAHCKNRCVMVAQKCAVVAHFVFVHVSKICSTSVLTVSHIHNELCPFLLLTQTIIIVMSEGSEQGGYLNLSGFWFSKNISY